MIREANAMGLTIGNRPLAIAFNETTVGTFEHIRPTVRVKTVALPGVLSDTGEYLNKLYVLDTPALIDRIGHPLDYRFFIEISALATVDPGIADNSDVTIMDLTWCLDDRQVWIPCWGDESVDTADGDAGMDALANVLVMNFA